MITTAAAVAKDTNETDVVTPPSTDYVGKHRAPEPTDGGTSVKTDKKVARDFFKELKSDIKKLTTKKDRSGSSSEPKAGADDQETKKVDKEASTNESSSSSAGSSSDAGSES